ncbi:hypothetical protein PGT21_023089 [Puccinia graminis f. sp. tritici]|uniref:Ras-GAP domain-containing protein n=1 Tax=Puccinia graminis f. sp. tritici TaxID=56615 RepID=A0A5B0MM21_PUCGR|nr:hypothetical protein PGT21_023089 [Puccinia graminis f. sp. tritici]KAA1078865.1 hypothetical protein PGTUg99_011313 [Puccinia graminis f. sp. tritici]
MQKLVDSPTSSSSALNGFESHRARLKQFRRQAIHSIGLNSKLTQQEQQQQIRLTQDLTHSLTNPSSSPSAKPTLMMVNRKTEQEQPTLNPDSPIHLQSREARTGDRAQLLFRSTSRDSHRDRIEIHSPPASTKLDHLDLSITVDPARKSSISTTQFTVNQLGTRAQDPGNQDKHDDASNSGHRYTSTTPTELAEVDPSTTSTSKLGLSLLNPSQSNNPFRLDPQSDPTKLNQTVPGTSNQINPQALLNSNDGLQDDTHSDPSKPHLPQPLKIFAPSYRRSISAPFTSTGLVSLEFPGRLDSITEDGTLPASAQPDSSFNFMNPLQTPMPYGGANDSRESAMMKFPIETSPTIHFADRSSPAPSNSPDQPARIKVPSTQPNHKYRKWSGNFYVWAYDTPSTSPESIAQSSPAISSSPSTTSILSNNRIGGISRHFFQHVKPAAEAKPAKLQTAKKERRGVKLGLISGLTKQRDTVSCPQLELSATDDLSSQKANLHPHNLSEHSNAIAGRSTNDPNEILQSNQPRPPASSKSTDQESKPKKLHFSSDARISRKKFLPESNGAGSPQGSITSQLALGPGAAMNSQGIGSGQWKLVQGVITEDGHFTLYAGNDVTLYRIYLPSYRRTDIRMVHQSIFGRPHCGVITRRTGSTVQSAARIPDSALNSSSSLPLHASPPFQSSTNGPTPLTPSHLSTFDNPHQLDPSAPLPLTVGMKDASTNPDNIPGSPTHQQSDTSSGTTELSIYICMPNSVLLESWLVICKCFCRPDDFRHLYPRSSKKNQAAGHQGTRHRVLSLTGSQSTHQPSSSPALSSAGDIGSAKGATNSTKQALPERVRIWRGVEIQLVEGRKLGETRQMAVNTMTNDSSGGVGIARLVTKDERRNSTGGFLPTGSQASLLSINKSGNNGRYQTGQQSIIADPNHPHEHLNKKLLSNRYDSKNVDESDSSTTGFSSSITSSLTHSNQPGGQVNRQSIPTASTSNFEDKPPSTTSITTPISILESSTHGSKNSSISNNGFSDNFYFVEFDWDREIIGRSTIKRNANPFWSESFKFSEIGSFKTPLILNVYQIRKNFNHPQSKSSLHHSHSHHPNSSSSSSSTSPSKITLIGQSYLDFKIFEKNVQLPLWLPIYSTDSSAAYEPETDENSSNYEDRDKPYKKVEIMGEINLSITVIEQVVLAEPEYSKMMNYLNNDDDIVLPLDLANMAVGELDRLAELLIRIYEANNRLFMRFSQLAAIEINGDISTASILFRANTLLTKMLEAYMRIVGSSFLESSVGAVIRRICMAKAELEIDPSKLKTSLSSHHKEKIVNENAKELKRLSSEIWQSMYINRSKCPNRLRKIFVKIQELVGNAYDDQDMRLTSISAFVFLRFFVPAILNPRLFNLIQFQPDSKSQRTLTLVAKTLQGLGNLTLFGIKEPWMSVMNEFITTQLDSFRDYISFIASESDSTKPEWTSKEYEGYGLPYALRASLPASSRDGIPTLPHLLDPVRDCSLLASLITIIKRKASVLDSSRHHSSVLPPKTTKLIERHGTRPRRCTEASEFRDRGSEMADDGNSHSTTTEFLKICGDLYAKSERRYLKIIQSESKDPNAPNKASSTTATTTTTTTATTTTATSDHRAVSTTASPVLPGAFTHTQDVLSQSKIYSRKWAFNNNNDRPGQPSPPTPTSLTRSPSTSLSSSTTTRWKRSHTITAEQGSSTGSKADHLSSPNCSPAISSVISPTLPPHNPILPKSTSLGKQSSPRLIIPVDIASVDPLALSQLQSPIFGSVPNPKNLYLDGRDNPATRWP